jgi:hypothetical protein
MTKLILVNLFHRVRWSGRRGLFKYPEHGDDSKLDRSAGRSFANGVQKSDEQEKKINFDSNVYEP